MELTCGCQHCNCGSLIVELLDRFKLLMEAAKKIFLGEKQSSDLKIAIACASISAAGPECGARFAVT